MLFTCHTLSHKSVTEKTWLHLWCPLPFIIIKIVQMIFSLLAFIYLSTPEALHAVCAVGGWWLCITSFGLSRTWLCLRRSGELCWILILIVKILYTHLTHLHEPKLLLPHFISLVWSLLQPREQKTETVFTFRWRPPCCSWRCCRRVLRSVWMLHLLPACPVLTGSSLSPQPVTAWTAWPLPPPSSAS